MSAAAYGASPIKRRRRTKGAVEQLELQILDVLEEDHPQSVRHVFYRLTDPRLPEPVDKTELGYRVVQNRLTLMRRSGDIPYGWISDATRRGYFTPTYANGADFLRRHIGAYRADLWALSDYHVEVWCESRSIAGVIQDDCQELAVSLFPCGGFSSITFAYEAAQAMTPILWDDEIDEINKQGVIIYIGDYDPAGVLIDQSLEAELRRHLPEGLGLELEFVRLAITPEQIAIYDLPTKPRKDTDRRAQHVTETVEAEAMPAAILRGLLRCAIEVHLPEGALEVAKAAEESERAHLRRWAELMQNRGAP
jgi:hypothetical protein